MNVNFVDGLKGLGMTLTLGGAAEGLRSFRGEYNLSIKANEPENICLSLLDSKSALGDSLDPTYHVHSPLTQKISIIGHKAL